MTSLPVGTYAIDPSHSEVGFSVRHAGISKVRGRFGDVAGTVVVADDFASSTANATIQLASVETGSADRDGHLKSADFFDVENNPEMTFETTRVEGGAEEFTLVGNLTLKGVTREVSLATEYQGAATDPFGNERIGFEATTDISRKDFGLTWNAALETGGVLVGDKVTIVLEVSAIKQV